MKRITIVLLSIFIFLCVGARKYDVKYICQIDHSASTDFPIPRSFSGETDCTYEDSYFVKLIPLRHSNNEYIYEMLLPSGISTDHIICIKNAPALDGKLVQLLFVSGSVEKPNHPKYKDYPRYYTTQYYIVMDEY